MIRYDFPLYRPPAEADNVILQATIGCSHNNCTFCSMYKSKKYRIRDFGELIREIDLLCRYYPDTHKVFLGDGDALSLPTDHLVKILQYLKRSFPKLSRVSVYATAQNILEKSDEELRTLYNNHLSLLYFGIESGHDPLLQKISKGVRAESMIDALNKASEAGIKISATVILGLGGEEFSREHIRDTARLVNATRINYLSTLQLGLEEGIKERFFKPFEHFTLLDDWQILDEQKRLLEAICPENRVIFRSNHASNALHLSGTLPKDTARLLEQIKQVQSLGEGGLVPKRFRGF